MKDGLDGFDSWKWYEKLIGIALIIVVWAGIGNVIFSCTSATTPNLKPATADTVKIYVADDGSYTVFTRHDSAATFVNKTKDGALLDSTWMLADPNTSSDSVIQAYYRTFNAGKHQ